MIGEAGDAGGEHDADGDFCVRESADGVEAAWALVDPILGAWREAPPSPFPNYSAGSAGPLKAMQLIESDNRQWRPL